MKELLTHQEAASLEGPRHLKVPGSPTWCWQTLSALQSLWRAANLDYALYEETLQEANTHEIWMKIPPDDPFGSREKMLETMGAGDELQARARVAAQSIPARPMPKLVRGRNGRFQSDTPSAGQHSVKRGRARAAYLTARIARDRPDIWERMKNGEFTSVAAAAREAGIAVKNPKRVVLANDVTVVAAALKNHYKTDQLQGLIDALQIQAPGLR